MGVASALVMGGIAAWSRSGGWFVSDFDQLWIAGRSLLAREDPYAGVLASGNQYPLYYPLPAVLVTLPLALLPLGLARTVLAVCTAFVAGYGLRRLGRWAWLALLAPVWWAAAIQGQIAPALAGAALVPTLGFLLATKPTIGLALWISRPSLRAAISVAAILVISVVVWPEWPLTWVRTIQDAPHIRAPVQRPGGVLLLLALLRWRSPEGRLLAAWAIIPRTESLYDMLPLFLLADSAASMGLLVVGTILALLGLSLMPPPSHDLAVRLTANWPVLFGCVYLPALLIVLRPVIEPRLPRLRARAAEPAA